MPSTRSSITAAVIAVAAASPLMADVIVIRAIGPSAVRYNAGKTLPDTGRLTLQKGDQVVLLDAHGTRTISGPGTFTATGAQNSAASTIVALASNTADRRNRVGAVRNLPTSNGPAIRPNIFLVDVTAAGNMCIADPASVTLWRGQADTAGMSTIVSPQGTSATVAWIKGQSTQPWPATLPIAAGGTYRVTQTGPAKPGPAVMIAFRLLPVPPQDLQQLAKDLIASDCKAQVDVMVATTSPATGG